MTREASAETITASMKKRRLPQHWLLRLVSGLPVCCLLLTIPSEAFTSPISSKRQHVSVRSSWATSPGKQQWRTQSQAQYRRRIQRSDLSMDMRQMPRANVAVSLDQPLFPVKPSPTVTGVTIALQSIQSLIKLPGFKVAVAAFSIALLLTLVARSAKLPKLEIFWKIMQGRVSRAKDSRKKTKEGVAMTFESEDNVGWGVCSLRSKKRLGKSSFVQYDFDLPEPNQFVQLDLGQQLSLCCLDNNQKVAKGDFYLYHGHRENDMLGTFSILAPNRTPAYNAFEVGTDAANFVRVMKDELKVGDEVAIQPGPRKLAYRGQYLPVTDMVYVACGVGIVPVIEQVRAVLPSGSSSVKNVNVIWVNEDTKDFDVISELLEKEYFKYTTKLAVSCIVDNLRANDMGANKEITSAIPEFQPGVMAVIAGPGQVSEKARNYLMQQDYPDDCICTL